MSNSQRYRNLAAAATTSAVALGSYIFTLCPNVMGGDSGDFINAALSLGIAHPPGYPLFTLVSRLAISTFPWATPAASVNALSAVFAALTIGLSTWLLIAWTGRVAIGMAFGLLLAANPLVWKYAVQSEVFTLNLLLTTTALLLAFRIEKAGSLRLFMLSTVLGLGLSNHHTYLFVAAPIVIVLLFKRGIKSIPPTAVGVCVGLLPYLYLPWAASQHPVFGWGDPSSLAGFLQHVLRRDYGTLHLGPWADGASFLTLISLYAGHWIEGAQIIVPILGLVGIAGVAKRGLSAWEKAMLAALFLSIVVFNVMANPKLDIPLQHTVLARFWLLPDLLVSLWAAQGFAMLVARIPRLTIPLEVATLALAGFGFYQAYGVSDCSRNTVVADFTRSILTTVEPDALILVDNDSSYYAGRYLQLAEGLRPDVAVIPMPLLKYPWMRSYLIRQPLAKGLNLPPEPISAATLLLANENRPLYYIGGVNREDYDAIVTNFVAAEFGLVTRLIPKDQTGNVLLAEWVKKSREALSTFDPKTLDGYPADSWEMFLKGYYDEADRRIDELAKGLPK